MRTETKNYQPPTDLAWSLEKHIQEKTFGQVRPLEVEMGNNMVIIHGRCPSYHVKQLAIQALLDMVPQTAPLHFALDIHVA